MKRIKKFFTTSEDLSIAPISEEMRLFYFRQKAPIPCLLSKVTEEDLQKRFY